jgi:hypothetical protein
VKGRKPIYPHELIAELAARVAAGESPSALAKEKGMSRSSVRRCAESARLPAEAKEQNVEASAQVGTARQRERLFWMVIESYMRQAIALAPKSTPRDVASMLEAVVKLRALMPAARTVPRLPERQKASETLLIFQRSLSQVVESPKIVEVTVEPVGDLSKADRTASKTACEEGGTADQAPPSEGNDATR